MERSGNSGKDIINSENLQGDFDFFDLLQIFWKRRYIILFGTAVIVVIIVVISFLSPPVYRSQTVFKPGLSHIDKNGKWVAVDSPLDMYFFIESEIKYKLAKQLKTSKEKELSPSLNYKIFTDKSIDTLTVVYDSSGSNEGIAKLRLLLNALKDSYNHALQPYLDQYESKIALARQEIALHLKEQEFINSNLLEIQRKFENYKGKNAVDAKGNPAGKMGQYLAHYSVIVEKTARLKQAQSKTDLRIAELKDKVTILETEKKKLRAIDVVQLPTRISGPDRSSMRLNIMAAPVVGFLVTAFLVLLVEYARKVISEIKR